MTVRQDGQEQTLLPRLLHRGPSTCAGSRVGHRPLPVWEWVPFPETLNEFRGSSFT